jgi:hypothetical protein
MTGPAKGFAEALYRRLVDGEFFGEAVRAARNDIFTLFPEVNTWGAYQCYGDPNYRLSHDGVTHSQVLPLYTTAHELVIDLEKPGQRPAMWRQQQRYQ